MSTLSLIDAGADDVRIERAQARWYYGVRLEQMGLVRVGTRFGVVSSPHHPPTPGSPNANRWTYTTWRVTENRRGRHFAVIQQRFLTDEEIAHFERLLSIYEER